MRRSAKLALLLGSLLPGSAFAQIIIPRASGITESHYTFESKPNSSVLVSVMTPFAAPLAYGYLPVQVIVENRSWYNGTWHFSFDAGQPTEHPGALASGVDLTVGAGRKASAWFLVPTAWAAVNTAPMGITTTATATTPAVRLGGPAPRSITTTAATVSGFGRGGPGSPSLAVRVQQEAEARAALAKSGLLAVPAGVTQATTQEVVNFPDNSASFLFVFSQTGPAAQLPRPPAENVPAGALVNLQPAAIPGQVVRTISYLDPKMPMQLSSDLPIVVAAHDLMRMGYLLPQPAVRITRASQLASTTQGGTSTASRVVTGYTRENGVTRRLQVSAPPNPELVFTEAGPAGLLPSPSPDALPLNTSVAVVPTTVPGEVLRIFTVTGPTTMGGSSAKAAAGSYSLNVVGTSPSTIQVSASGPGVIEEPHFWMWAGGGTATPPLAVSPSLFGSVRDALSLLRLHGNPNLTVLAPAQLPADWRTWSSFHAVVMRKNELSMLDSARQSALTRWVALGGLLVLDPAGEDGRAPGVTYNATLRKYEAAVESRTDQAVGFGRIIHLGEPIYAQSSQAVAELLQLGSLALGVPAASDLEIPPDSPLYAYTQPPVFHAWMIAVVLALFGALIGPINVKYFAPPGKRHRIFVTTPAIAIAAAVVLGGMISVSDGFGGRGARVALVAFIPGEDVAAVYQEQGSRTGLMGSRRFELGEETHLTSLPIEGFSLAGAETRSSQEEGEGGGDWFRSQWQQVHILRRLAPTPAGIELVGTGAGGAPIVQSSVPAILKHFSWINSGEVWIADEIVAGVPVTLRRAPSADWPRVPPAGSAHFADLVAAAASPEPGRWTATGAASVLAPIPTLASIDWTDAPVIYTGISAPPPDRRTARLPDHSLDLAMTGGAR